MPGTYGAGTGTVAYRPWMPSMSLKLSVTASARTRTSPGPGRGRVDVLEPEDVTAARRARPLARPRTAVLRGGVEREREVREPSHVA